MMFCFNSSEKSTCPGTCRTEAKGSPFSLMKEEPVNRNSGSAIADFFARSLSCSLSCFSSLSFVHMSSLSRNAIHSPEAILTPWFRACDTPLFPGRLIRWMRESFCAYFSTISAVRSWLQSFITSTSKSGYVCAQTDASVSPIYFSEL